jgi:cytosine deaminase
MLEPLHYWIVNVRIPNCFIDSEIIGQNLEAHLSPTLQRDRLFPCHLEIRNGQIAKILPSYRISEIPTEVYKFKNLSYELDRLFKDDMEYID